MGLHAAGVAFSFPDAGAHQYMAKVYGHMLVLAIAVLNTGPLQRVVALAALSFGGPVVLTWQCDNKILQPIAIVFLMKLVLAFSVIHHPVDGHGAAKGLLASEY